LLENLEILKIHFGLSGLPYEKCIRFFDLLKFPKSLKKLSLSINGVELQDEEQLQVKFAKAIN
jgi:hypothetical protein